MCVNCDTVEDQQWNDVIGCGCALRSTPASCNNRHKRAVRINGELPVWAGVTCYLCECACHINERAVRQ